MKKPRVSSQSVPGRFRLTAAVSLAIAAPGMCLPVSPVGAGEQPSLQLPAQEEGARSFAISPKPLAEALNDFIAVTDWQVGFPAALAKDIRSPGVSGSYTPEQALQKLLQGTGLIPRFTGKGTVILEKPAVIRPDQGAMLGKVTVTARTDPSEDRTSYALPKSFSATKTDTPIMETPVSVQVVSRAVMDDQQAIKIQDALKNVSGVQGGDDFYDSVIIRGFDTSSVTFRNGLRQDSITNLETANLSRLEVLKGPAAVLFGRIQPGGLINLVTKRALDEPYFSVQQQFGSWDLYRTTIDATGPLLDDKSLLGRINIAYQSNNSYRDFVSNDHVFVAPSLTWRPNEKFDFNLDLEYQHDSFVQDNGLVALDGAKRPAPLPINRFLGDGVAATNHPNTQEKVLVAFDWNYRFNDDWKVTNRFRFSDIDYFQFLQNNAFMVDDRHLAKGFWFTPLHRATYGTNLDVTGKFDTGILHHDVLVGFDYYKFEERDGPGHWLRRLADGTVALKDVDIFSPVNVRTDVFSRFNPALDNNFSWIWRDEWLGTYFQDQITLFDKLHILGGGRYDWARNGSGLGDGQSPFSTIQVQTVASQAFNPRVGVLYQPWSWLSLYGNYVESFGNNNGLSATGTPFAPETAQQYEAGVKTELFDQRLTSTLAFYNLTKQNVLTTDSAGFSVAVGEVRSRGAELDVTGKITDNLSLIGTYAYTDAVITKGIDGAPAGNRFLGVPRNSGSLWAKYEIDSGELRGLSFGTGVYARSQREGNVENTFQLPGYARWDANVAYSFKQFGSKVTTQFNVYNILDKDYFDRSTNQTHIYPGQPLSFLGSVRVEY